MTKRDQIQEEALNVALQYNRCTLAISMGVGKTYIGLQYIQHFYNHYGSIKVLVAAPKVSIFQSWLDDAIKFKLGMSIIHSIKFTTYLSLPKQQNDYDILILDEAHSLLDSHSDYLSTFKGRILGLTGTPPRHDRSEKGKLVNQYCPVKYKYITDDAVDDNILNDYKITVHYVTLSKDNNIPVETKKMKFYTSEEKNYDYWSHRLKTAVSKKEQQICSVMRMRALMGFKTKEFYARKLLNQSKNKCLVFCNTQEQSDAICTHSYHTKNPNSQDNMILFKEGKIQKMSCVLQLNEGVTIPDLKEGIILHAYGNERKSNQRIGRLLRLNPDDTAQIHILCYKNTVDEKWVESALQDLDPNKIEYVNSYLNKDEYALQ
jgi:superfamily II DNA or RNA helicase